LSVVWRLQSDLNRPVARIKPSFHVIVSGARRNLSTKICHRQGRFDPLILAALD
jgi:hypothetical protein